MIWSSNNEISIIFSEKSDGDMLFEKRGLTRIATRIDADKRNEKVRINRIKFFKKHNINPERLMNLAGIHSANIAIARDSDLGRGALDAGTRIPNTDGMITNVKNSYLMITGADCFPVFFYDLNKGVAGVAHAGWKGVIKEISLEMIDKFKDEFGSNPADIQVWIGPGIKPCHYDVPEERVLIFSKNYKKHIIEKGGRFCLDLGGIIALQLTVSGVKKQNITVHSDCTFCEKEKYFSYRRDKPNTIEANAFIIHLK